MEALGAISFFLLVVHAVTHVALAVAIMRVKSSRGALAFVFPPAGVVWGWEAGKKGLVVAYGATLLAFSVVVTVIVYGR